VRRRHRKQREGSAIDLLAYAELMSRARERGEPGAQQRYEAACSWVDMAEASGWDREIVTMFLEFTRAG
jgi:hypothetical protein